MKWSVLLNRSLRDREERTHFDLGTVETDVSHATPVDNRIRRKEPYLVAVCRVCRVGLFSRSKSEILCGNSVGLATRLRLARLRSHDPDLGVLSYRLKYNIT